jgi:hypothetical protein
MAFVSNIETMIRDRRPRAYRRIETTVNDVAAPDDTRKVARFELKMLLPQIRRDSRDTSFGEADRAYMSALIRRIDAWEADRAATPPRFGAERPGAETGQPAIGLGAVR